MIISAWKPKTKLIDKKQVIIYYTLCDIEEIYKPGSSNIRVIYKCDCENCKNPNKIYAINRNHLNEKRSKTVNEKMQICRSCQTSGDKNPRFGDNRKWEDIMGSEKSKSLKMTFSDKWKGDRNPSKKDSIKEKKKTTNLNKIGVENPFQSIEIINKIKETCLEKYGTDSYTKTDEYKIRVKKTNLEKYGVCFYLQTEDFKLKSKKTSLEKWGVDSYTKTDEYKRNRIDHTKSEDFRNDRFILTKDKNYIKYIGNSISLFKCDKGHNFEISSSSYVSRIKSNLPICTTCYTIGDQKSIKEKELFNFIQSTYDGKITQSYRDGLEIDIYLPQLKLGFEFNGIYWHNEEKKGKYYHLNKTNYFKSKGINIFHIWEDDWNYKNDIIKSMILNKIGKTPNKIFARNCTVKEVENKEYINFLNKNHIQGFVGSKIKIGLYYNDSLVSLMCFDQFEGRKKMGDGEYNLNRFCNLLNTNVVGGSSKLITFFIKNYNPKRIISYADKDWSVGDLYYKLGFKLIKETNPDYKYIVGNVRTNKSKFRKSNLKTNLTESQEMIKKGIGKIYDCGKIKFEINENQLKLF